MWCQRVQTNTFQLILTSEGERRHIIVFNYAQLPDRGTVNDQELTKTSRMISCMILT